MQPLKDMTEAAITESLSGFGRSTFCTIMGRMDDGANSQDALDSFLKLIVLQLRYLTPIERNLYIVKAIQALDDEIVDAQELSANKVVEPTGTSH